MKSDLEIASQFRKHRDATLSRLSAQYNNTRKCQAFYSGDCMAYHDTLQFVTPGGTKKKAMVQFNQVKPYVNAVKGFMAQNRRKGKYVARMNASKAQEMYSQYANALADYVRDNANADQVETQQDGDMLICGYGATETALTYGDGFATTDPNGEILKGRLDPLAVGFDPYARESNLLDARWVFYKKEYELQEAMDLFDDSKEEDFEEGGEEDRDTGYTYYPGGGNVDRIKDSTYEWSDETLKIVQVYFYQWYEIESFYRAQNPIYTLNNPMAVQAAALQLEILAQEANQGEYADMFTFDPRAEILTFDAKTKTQLLEMFGQFIEVFEFKRKVFYTAVISGTHVFTAYRSPTQQGFTIKFKTGDYDARAKIWTGMVNSMMEPQLYYNKSLTELMFIIGSNSKGGVMVEREAVEDIEDFEAKYAKTDGVIIVNSGAISGNKIMPKKEPFQPTGYENIVSLTAEAISTVNGIDKTFLGSSENRDETALLQRQRLRQITSALACYVDSITLYQKEDARMLLDFLRIYAENNAGSLFRILGDDGAQEFVEISGDKFAAEYDVVVQEAPQTPDEKMEFADLLSTMADKLLAVGDPAGKVIYAIALKYLPIDKADIQQLTAVLMPQDESIDPAYVQQLEQTIQELTSEMNQADVRAKLSAAALNLAKVDQVKADVTKKGAETAKVLEEAERTSVETLAARKADKKNISLTI